jgi:hypothetical protein
MDPLDMKIDTETFATVLVNDETKTIIPKESLEFVTAADDFLVFKSIMVSKNIELEEEAWRLYYASIAGQFPAEQQASLEASVGPDLEDEAMKVTGTFVWAPGGWVGGGSTYL